MTEEVKRILVLLDDDQDARDVLAEELRQHNFDVRAPNIVTSGGKADIAAIRSAFRTRPDIAIIDPVWESRSYSLNALTCIAQALSAVRWSQPAQAFILSGYRLTKDQLESWPRIWNEKIGQWLNVVDVIGKPISIGRLLRLLPERGKPPIREIRFDFQRLRLPARLIDSTGAARSSNLAWSWGANEPTTGVQEESGRQFLVTEMRPDSHGVDREVSVSYRLQECHVKNPAKHRLQVAYPTRSNYTRSKFDFLKELFDQVQTIGFTHMRYYERFRVPQAGSNVYLAQVKLVHWLPENGYTQLAEQKQGVGLFSERGEPLVDRLSEFDCGARPTELIYKFAKDDETQARRSYFNMVTDTPRSLDRVRVPVFRMDATHSVPTYAQALLVLDRRAHKTRRAIVAKDVEWLKAPLLGACEELRRLLTQEQQRSDRRDMREICNDYSQVLGDAEFETAPKDFASRFLDVALRLSEAHEGVLLWCAHPGLVPNLMAVRSREKSWATGEPIRQGEPINESKHPAAFRAWTEGRPCFLPQYRYRRGSKQWEQSRLGLPLKIGNTTYGAIGLMHAKPLHFWKRRVDALKQLVEFFVFPLQHAAAREDRRTWEQILTHDLGNSLVGARNSIDQYLEQRAVRSRDNSAAAALQHIQRGLDTVESFVNLQKPQLSAVLAPIEPDLIVAKEVDFLRSLERWRENSFRRRLGARSARIQGSGEALGQIIRNLIRNAVRHGDQGKPVSIRTRMSESHWHLCVTNSGQMSMEADTHKFDPFYHNRDRAVAGVHIGLPSSLRLAQVFHANLTLQNKPGNKVCAELIWPLFKTDRQ